MRYKRLPKNKRRPHEEIVPKCGKKAILYKVNQTSYTIKKVICKDIIICARMGHLLYVLSDGSHCFTRAFGKYVFKTKKEAMDKLNSLTKLKQKRMLLKEYEEKINKQLGLKNHYYFK